MSKRKIDSYFIKSVRDVGTNNPNVDEAPSEEINVPQSQVEQEDSRQRETQRVDVEANINIERDPGKRLMIWKYPSIKKDEVRRLYLKLGPYKVKPEKKPELVDKYGRRFLSSWYDLFPDWLEWSPTKNAGYCLKCYVFGNPSTVYGSNAFVVNGFQSWKKVNEEKDCAFLTHEGYSPNSSHKIAVRKCEDMMNSLQHIDKMMDKHSSELVAKNRLRLKLSVDVVKLCAFQGLAFRGHDERVGSRNRGNFLEIHEHTASYNKEVALYVKEAPLNATYTSSTIQKEILSIYARRIQRVIREEIGDGKFCIIVDESRDESKREQMAIILRFVDKGGVVQERFFEIVHVEDTKSPTLKKKICDVLSFHNLSVQNIRGQGYDGASNMRGEWNGLQALFLSECPYAYYIHCFAHRLQATTHGVIPVEHFLSHLNTIINAVGSSSKRHDQLHLAQSLRIAELISSDELETGTRKNQVGNIQHACDTRWSSHLNSLHSLLKMFDSTLVVLSEIINDKGVVSSKAAADGSYDVMMTYEFVFILHFLIELLGKTNSLCRILQDKSLDILHAIDTVANTKEIVQKFREGGWAQLCEKVKTFCEKREIDVPDISGPLRSSKGRAKKGNPITLEHHYRVDIFNGTIDNILQEMKYRFNEDAMELLQLSSTLDPRDGFKNFDINKVCRLVEKFYPRDFTDQEKLHIRYQLELFEVDVRRNTSFQHAATISQLCEVLSTTGKSKIYFLVDRLIRLILVLPVSTATSERAFSAMKIVKTRLRNKMQDDFLSSSLIMHIEKEIAQSFDVDSIIDEFDCMKHRKSKIKVPRWFLIT